jgi:hypothetical protein
MKRTNGFVYKGHIYILVDTPKGKLCKLCVFKDLFVPCADSPGCGKDKHYERKK